jgi:hypothetical protein
MSAQTRLSIEAKFVKGALVFWTDKWIIMSMDMAFSIVKGVETVFKAETPRSWTFEGVEPVNSVQRSYFVILQGIIAAGALKDRSDQGGSLL